MQEMTAKLRTKPGSDSKAPKAASRARPASEPAVAVLSDRRTTILDAARRRFAEFGFEATTVRQIADDVNILSGSLYHHFASKEEMLHEIVRDAALGMRDNAIRIAKAAVDPEHRLIALVILELGEMTRDQQSYAILSHERKFFRRKKEFAYIVDAKKGTYLAWEATLKEGASTGLFKPDLDIYLTITTIVRMLSAAADWYRNEDASIIGRLGDYTLDKLTDFHLDFVLSAVRVPSRASAPIPRSACKELALFRAA
jgi:AcrR family transcriptional regulator